MVVRDGVGETVRDGEVVGVGEVVRVGLAVGVGLPPQVPRSVQSDGVAAGFQPAPT